MKSAIAFALYLGVGVAVQTVVYQDVRLVDLLHGNFPLSVIAHILAWPLFFALLVYWFLFLCILTLIVLSLIAMAYVWWSEHRRMARYKDAVRKRSAPR